MLSTTLYEAAVEFGLAVRQAPAVAAYRDAEAALEADPVAQRLLADLRERQTEFTRLQQAGVSPSEQQIDQLRLCHEAVRASESIMTYLRATNEVKAYLPLVATEVSVALGTDYARLAAPERC